MVKLEKNRTLTRLFGPCVKLIFLGPFGPPSNGVEVNIDGAKILKINMNFH